MPSTTPGGILIFTVEAAETRPSPRHDRHGEVITWPVPPQLTHVVALVKLPNIVVCACATAPRPPQTRQDAGFEPAAEPEPSHLEQTSGLIISISFSTPSTACLKCTVTLVPRLAPASAAGRRDARAPKPSKMTSKMSSNPKP